MQVARIIVVDDEPLTRATYARGLAAEGHAVRTACDVFACRAALRTEPADVVVLDLGLPGVDGMAFAAELRAQGDVGVIVVTSRADVGSRIAALDQGADDYLVKPPDLGELAARVRSLLRRRDPISVGRFRIGPWTADLSRRTILDAEGRTVVVTRGEFDLISRLIEARGKIVSREALSQAVRRGDAAGDPRSVDALVSRLRRKLPSGGQSILTAPGFGYRLGHPADPVQPG